jgi:hypothetical protein
VKDKNFQQLTETVGEAPKRLAQTDEYLLVANR